MQPNQPPRDLFAQFNLNAPPNPPQNPFVNQGSNQALNPFQNLNPNVNPNPELQQLNNEYVEMIRNMGLENLLDRDAQGNFIMTASSTEVIQQLLRERLLNDFGNFRNQNRNQIRQIENRNTDSTFKINKQNQSNLEKVLEIQGTSWENKNFDLFDFKKFGHQMKLFQFKESCILRIRKGKIKSCTEKKLKKKKNDYFFRIKKENKQFSILPNTQEEVDQKINKHIYVVVRSLRNTSMQSQKGYILRTKDLIRFGQEEYKVLETGKFKKTKNTKDYFKNFKVISCEELKITDKLRTKDLTHQIKDQTANEKDPNETPKTCRYCLMESFSDIKEEDYLVSPCACKGEFEFVHMICLKKWIQEKIISKKTEDIIIYEWHNTRCEFCHHRWPSHIKIENKYINLFEMIRPKQEPYMILKNQSNQEDPLKSKFIILILRELMEIKIGKGSNCQFRIKGPSVEEIHAKIEFKKDDFYIYDNESQFGTLVRLRDNWNIKSQMECIQIGRTIFTFSLRSVEKTVNS
jgi:hypothetical protein